MTRSRLWALAACLGVLALTPSVMAIPTLQIYIEGASYDTATDTWVLSGGSGTFKLWVIGDVGSYGTISNVKLSAAVSTSELSGSSISIASSTTAALADPSTPIAPTLSVDPNVTANDGQQPVKGDGSLLQKHDVFGPGTSYFQWEIGDFTLTDSPIGDYNAGLPSSYPSTGQINVYDVTVTGFTSVHFDAFDSIVQANNHVKYVVAPPSHDGGYGDDDDDDDDDDDGRVPEPGTITLTLLGLSSVGAAVARRRRRRSA